MRLVNYREAYELHPILNAIKIDCDVHSLASSLVYNYDGFCPDFDILQQKPERVYMDIGVKKKYPCIETFVFVETVEVGAITEAPCMETPVKKFSEVHYFFKSIEGVKYRIAYRRNESDNILQYDYYRIKNDIH